MNLPAVAEPRNTPARVLHVITRLDRGGSADNTISSCLGLDRRGWKVTLAYGKTADPTPLLAELEGRETISAVQIPSLVRAIAPMADLRAYRRLRRMLLARDYEIVHTHSSKAGLLGRRAARGLGPRIVHTPHGNIFEGYFPSAVSRLFIGLERRAARWCDRIVTLTDMGREAHLSRGVGQRQQFITIPSGVRLEPYRRGLPDRRVARASLALPQDGYVVGCVARLTPVKGQRYLLDAVARLARRRPSVHVLLVGDGELREALAEQAASGPLSGRVVFSGMLSDARESLAAMDLFVMPSLNEGQCRAVVEAMAAGLPVVASSVGGLPEVLAGGAAGLLVPPEDPRALASAIERVMDDPQEAVRLSSAGRRQAERYDESIMIDCIENLYRDLLEE